MTMMVGGEPLGSVSFFFKLPFDKIVIGKQKHITLLVRAASFLKAATQRGETASGNGIPLCFFSWTRDEESACSVQRQPRCPHIICPPGRRPPKKAKMSTVVASRGGRDLSSVDAHLSACNALCHIYTDGSRCISWVLTCFDVGGWKCFMSEG